MCFLFFSALPTPIVVAGVDRFLGKNSLDIKINGGMKVKEEIQRREKNGQFQPKNGTQKILDYHVKIKNG